VVFLVSPGKCRDVSQLDHGRFLPNPFEFIIHPSPYLLLLCSLDTEIAVHNPQKTICNPYTETFRGNIEIILTHIGVREWL
jgi:hypothetical protein